MSGYLEVKYPFKSLGLNPFKSWRRQWCILRPSPTCLGGGSLAVYCSEAGSSVGTVELPVGCVVRRAKSRTRPNAFALFSSSEPRKPLVLLAAQSLHDTQSWMEKIKALLNTNNLIGSETLLKDTYSVSVVTTELSRKCGLNGADGVLTVTSSGLFVSPLQKLSTFIEWKCISDVLLISDGDKNNTCVLTIDSNFCHGGGELKLSSPLADKVTRAVRQALDSNSTVRCCKKLSKSEGDLRTSKCSDTDNDDVRRSSWYSGPSEVSLDDIDLIMSKEVQCIPHGQLSRYRGAGHLAIEAAGPTLGATPTTRPRLDHTSMDDSMSDRRSLLSIASGIYEEIPDLPVGTMTNEVDTSTSTMYCSMGRDIPDGRDYIGQTAYCAMEGVTRDRERHQSETAYSDMGQDIPDGVIIGASNISYCAMGGTPDSITSNSVSGTTYCGMDGDVIDGVTCSGDRRSDTAYCAMGRDLPAVLNAIHCEEPTYESVAECVYATMRRTGKRYLPPPLPPRLPFGMKLGESWNCRAGGAVPRDEVTRHGSLGSLPRCCGTAPAAPAAPATPATPATPAATLPKCDKGRQFSVFRKRLKSDSRIATSPKSDTSKESKDVETKKKKFDFTPTIFKSFKVSRKMKNLKITGTLAKSETKSCEFLDETEHVTTNRCSKSVECLEKDEFRDEFDGDLSLEFNDDALSTLALPQEIVDSILRGREMFSKIRLKDESESDYMPMSPIVSPPPIEHHYIVMSPRSNLA